MPTMISLTQHNFSGVRLPRQKDHVCWMNFMYIVWEQKCLDDITSASD